MVFWPLDALSTSTLATPTRTKNKSAVRFGRRIVFCGEGGESQTTRPACSRKLRRGRLPPLGGRPTIIGLRDRLILPVTPEEVIHISLFFNINRQIAIYSDQERCSLPIPTRDALSPLALACKKLKMPPCQVTF